MSNHELHVQSGFPGQHNEHIFIQRFFGIQDNENNMEIVWFDPTKDPLLIQDKSGAIIILC